MYANVRTLICRRTQKRRTRKRKKRVARRKRTRRRKEAKKKAARRTRKIKRKRRKRSLPPRLHPTSLSSLLFPAWISVLATFVHAASTKVPTLCTLKKSISATVRVSTALSSLVL